MEPAPSGCITCGRMAPPAMALLLLATAIAQMSSMIPRHLALVLQIVAAILLLLMAAVPICLTILGPRVMDAMVSVLPAMAAAQRTTTTQNRTARSLEWLLMAALHTIPAWIQRRSS